MCTWCVLTWRKGRGNFRSRTRPSMNRTWEKGCYYLKFLLIALHLIYNPLFVFGFIQFFPNKRPGTKKITNEKGMLSRFFFLSPQHNSVDVIHCHRYVTFKWRKIKTLTAPRANCLTARYEYIDIGVSKFPDDTVYFFNHPSRQRDKKSKHHNRPWHVNIPIYAKYEAFLLICALR